MYNCTLQFVHPYWKVSAVRGLGMYAISYLFLCDGRHTNPLDVRLLGLVELVTGA